MSSTQAGGHGPRSGLVGSEVAHPAVGTLLVVDGDPVGDDDAGLGERVELPAAQRRVGMIGLVPLFGPAECIFRGTFSTTPKMPSRWLTTTPKALV